MSSPAKLGQDIKVFMSFHKKYIDSIIRDSLIIEQGTSTKSASETSPFGTRAKKSSFSESNEPFFDRLDIFSDVTNLENTLVL